MSSVDIVVPCYNYARFLPECVGSVLAQEGVDLRVLIIDDCSADDTPQVAAELMAQDPRVSFRRHAQNRGHIDTYNEGLLEWAAADYSLLLSADDYLLPGALGRASRLMDRFPEVAFTFGPAHEFRPGDVLPAPTGEPDEGRAMSGREYVEMSGPADLVPTATAVVRTTVQQRAGGYRHDLPHAGDMEMWLRLASLGGVGMFATPQAVYRRHDANMSLTYFLRKQMVLPDLQQRAGAFAAFYAGPAQHLPDLARLKARTIGALAGEAIWEAHFAFEAGRIEACRELLAFAEGLYPPIRRGRPWMTLALKRGLGVRAWTAVAPAASAAWNLVRLRPAG